MRLECPLQCGTDNEPEADRCAGCGCPLRNHTRLSAYAAQLFNQGLVAARTGELSEARELFAAVVHWMPKDRKARNALALANFELGDEERARFHWNQVLAQRASDSFATTGLQRLAQIESPTAAGLPENAGSPAEGESCGGTETQAGDKVPAEPTPALGTQADVAPSTDAGPLLDAERPMDVEPSVDTTDTTPPTIVEPLAADAQPSIAAEPQPDVETSADAEPARNVGATARARSSVGVEPPVDAELSASAEPKADAESSADVGSRSDNELSADAEPSAGVKSARKRRWFRIHRWFGGH